MTSFPVTADIVLRNGPIWCGRSEGVVEALALWQGRVLAAGRESEIAPLIGRTTRVIDLAGRLATPGLNDSHLHLLPLGLNMDWVDARPAAARRWNRCWARWRRGQKRCPPANGCARAAMTTPSSTQSAIPPGTNWIGPCRIIRSCWSGPVAMCRFSIRGRSRWAASTKPHQTPPGGFIETRDGG